MAEQIYDPLIADVQTRLRDLGYYGVGIIDGWITPQGETEAAILDFRNKNGLPLVPSVDDEFLRALANAPARQVSDARATATVSEVEQKVETVNQNWWTRMWAKVLAVPSGIGFIASIVVDNLDTAAGKFASLKSLVSDLSVPPWVWFALVGVGAFLIGRSASKAGVAAVEAFRSGAAQPDR